MKRWQILNKNQKNVSSIDEVIKILLENRGIKGKKQTATYLSPVLESVTLNAVGVKKTQVSKTLKRIKQAIDNNEEIIIFGDYDVDGICATAILWETLYAKYKNVHPYIPSRSEEGYGLSEKGILNALKEFKNIKVIITVDNGIVAQKAVDFAVKKGIDVIVTDHHVAGKTLPKAYSIIHTTELCGTGIAYLLSKELSLQLNMPLRENHLELVALATVADLVPLNQYNRTLLKFGLKELRKTKRIGLIELCNEAKIRKEEIDTYHIGHIIAPRLNATGRITHAMDALRLICTSDKKRAEDLAVVLGETNKKRQDLTFESSEKAKEQVKSENLQNLLFVHSRSYDQGVVGLIASRLVEEFYRPAIVVAVGDEISKGSARSISGVNIIKLIRSVPYYKEAGGHPMAAGFSVETKILEKFKKELIKEAKKIKESFFERVLKIDLELDFSFLTLELFDALQDLSPFGMANASPIFTTRGVTVVSLNSVGKNKEHLQVMLEKDASFFKGMLFRYENITQVRQGQLVDIVYSIEKNEWNGRVNLELKLKDIKLI